MERYLITASKSPESEVVASTRRSRRRCPFVEDETEQSGEELFDSEGEPEGREDAEGSIADSFIVPDDSCTPDRLTAADYAAIDRESEEQRETENAVESYFPVALATSRDSPLQFNFDLFLLDRLTLPCPIVEGQEHEGQVTFQSRLAAIEYCRTAMEAWKKENRPTPSTPHQPRKSHPDIDRDKLFASEGRSLQSLMESKDQEYDANLSFVREDRFGNVMILSSPSWAESSPQLTHGFPRKLISAEHGGFLPGNIICTAKATNQAIRRIATEDIACLVSRDSIAGAGFTVANLVNCRFAALRYRQTCYIPDYLVTGMLRTGVNFCTFERIEGEVLTALVEHMSGEKRLAWNQDMEGVGEESDSTTDDEPISDLGGFLEPSALEHLKLGAATKSKRQAPSRATPLTTALLSNHLGSRPCQEAAQPATEQPAPEGTANQTAPNTSSQGRGRKRRRQSTPGKSAGPSAEKRTTTPAAGEQALAIPGYTMPTIPVAEGFNVQVLPTGESLRNLMQFFDKNRPCSRQDTPSISSTSTPRPDSRGTDQMHTARTKEALRELWELCSPQCICRDESLPATACTFNTIGGGLRLLSGQCSISDRCKICAFFSRHEQVVRDTLSAAQHKNVRLRQLLSISGPVAQLYPTDRMEDGYRHKKQQLNRVLSQIFCCKENRLGGMRHIGSLSALVPKIKSVQLTSGWSAFWNELRKVAKAVNGQPDQHCKLLALTVIRIIIPQRTDWREFLTVGSEEETQVYNHYYLSSSPD